MSHPSIQQKQAAFPEHSCWVEASAGTGKTKVLTDRVLNLLLSGSPPENILCLTFTKAAAAEMSNRIQEKLAIWAALGTGALKEELLSLLERAPSSKEMERALTLFSTVIDVSGGMKIQTIHSFCQMVLKKFPLEAGVPPHFRVMSEGQSKECLEKAFQKALETLPPSLLKALAQHTQEEKLFSFLKVVLQKRSYLEGLDDLGNAEKEVYKALKIPYLTKPHSVLEQGLESSLLKNHYQELVDLLKAGTALDQKMGQALKTWFSKPFSEKIEEFEEYKTLFLTLKNEPRKKIVSSAFLKNHPSFEELLHHEIDLLISLTERYHHAIIAEATHAFLHFVHHALGYYETLKNKDALLDYDDLIHKTATLFQQEENAPWVLYKLDGGIQHILVDEAQDTNEDQWRVIAAIASEFFSTEPDPDRLRTLFVVGDMKQSIYSFQGASPFAFQAVKSLFSSSAEAAKHVFKNVTLSTSFRSTQPILTLVDDVFQKNPTLSPPGLDLAYVPHESHRKNQGGRVEVWPLARPPEKEEREAWALPNRQTYTTSARKEVAQRIASTIQSWLQEGRRIESKNRLVRPRDIMILVRRRDQFVEELVRALKNKSIPVTGIDRLVLMDHIAIMDLLVLGDFLLLPEDDLALATLLKTPLIGLSEEDLFDLAAYRKGRSLWHVLKQEQSSKPAYQMAFDYLTDLLNRVDFYSPFELYHHVLHILPGQKKMVERLGSDIEDALEEFLNLCLAFEKERGGPLQTFLSWVRKENIEIKRNLEQSTEDKVRIMTVHGSKGLQAPIVFLPDTTQVPTSHTTLFWDRSIGHQPLLIWCPKSRFKTDYVKSLHPQYDEQAEYYRLLYVALTRAEDELYVCGWENQKTAPVPSWYDAVLSAAKDLGAPHAFCFDGKTEEEGILLYQKAEEISSFVEEEKDKEKTFPLPSWIEKNAKTESSLSILYPSQQGEISNTSTGSHSQLSVRERGVLLHKALEWLIKDPGIERDHIIKNLLAKHVAPEEAEKLLTILRATTGLLDKRDYFKKGTILTEVPFQSFNQKENAIVKGAIDFLWIDDIIKEIHIIDYKTGAFDATYETKPPEAYANQMKLYHQAISTIYPNYKIRPFLLWTESSHLLECPFKEKEET
jgi:ATP-dependent helicase/nuclease subunit A